MHTHHSTARRSLIANQSILPQLATPIRSEATMRRAGYGIFIYAHSWGEEPRDEFIALRTGPTGDHDTASLYRHEPREIGLHTSHNLLRLHLDQVIELILAHIDYAHPQRLQQTRWCARSLL